MQKQMKKILMLVLMLLIVLTLIIVTYNYPSFSRTSQEGLKMPLTGKLVYQSYTPGKYDSVVKVYDFETQTVDTISKDWPVVNPINPHYSPDGKKITFMGIPLGAPLSRMEYDVFIYEFETKELTNITPDTSGEANEDPKFSPDGNSIVYQSNAGTTVLGQGIKIYNLKTKTSDLIVENSPEFKFENNMPYYTSDGKSIIYSESRELKEDNPIMRVDIATKQKEVLAEETGADLYYPIVSGENVYYSRSKADEGDDIFVKNLKTGKTSVAKFNQITSNQSDAAPVYGSVIVYSEGGNYDLVLGDYMTGETMEFPENVNTDDKAELGASYWRGGLVK